MRVQTETDLSIDVPDRCGNSCSEKSWTCALTGALYITRIVFENVEKIETPEDAIAAEASLDAAGSMLKQCDSAVHDEGTSPIRSTMDLDGNVTFSEACGEAVAQIPRPCFVDPSDVFGKVS